MKNAKYYYQLAELIYFTDGLPYWKVNRPTVKKDTLAGTLLRGYRGIGYTINGVTKLCRAHTLHWYIVYGYLPKRLDHINRDRDDNRINNLRECTKSQNNRNKTKKLNCTSKYNGVSWDKSSNKWRAQIKLNKVKNLGRFDCEHCCALAYDNALIKYSLREFGNFNFKRGELA